MTFQQAIITCFRKYFTFSGRASRSEYWWFFLFILLASILLSIADTILFGTGMTPAELAEADEQVTHDANGPLSSLFSLATILPMLAAGWRRMHDSGRSGLYLFYPMIAALGLLTFIGFAGGIEALSSDNPFVMLEDAFGIITGLAIIVVAISPFFVLFWLTRPSQPGPNQYGPNPHEVHP